MAAVLLKVTTEELKAGAAALQEQIEGFEKDWEQISGIVDNEKRYWAGEAADLHRAMSDACRTDVVWITNRLSRLTEDMLVMAGVYEATEREAVRATQAVSRSF